MNTPNISAPTPQPNFPITPDVFWAKFSTALQRRWKTEEVDVWWFNDLNKRTEFMTDVLKKLAKDEFGCHCDCEYWPRVDVSYFDRCSKEDWTEWSREAAIELENDDSWTDEVCKLMQINAGFKVLIAYVDKDNPKKLKEFLDRLPVIYQSRKYVPKPCNWLFIFGLFGELDWDFIAYKFDGDKTTEITGNVRIRPLAHETIV
jgi:hypothetical protein